MSPSLQPSLTSTPSSQGEANRNSPGINPFMDARQIRPLPVHSLEERWKLHGTYRAASQDRPRPERGPISRVESGRNPPQYLFRAASKKSRGINSASCIIPDATLSGIGHETIHDIPVAEAKHMLMEHFLWRYKMPSEFSSWSTSLLWVLQHAVRREAMDGEASDVCIYILNTRKLQDVSIYPATTLLRLYEIEDRGKLRHEYYQAEHLAHGAIEETNSFQVVSLKQLKASGLYDALPELDDPSEKHRLYWRVLNLRRDFFERPWPVTPSELRSVKRLGDCFGGEWVLPMIAAFLSLRRRESGFEDRPYIANNLDGIEIPPHYHVGFTPFEDLCISTTALKEVDQFAVVLRKLYETLTVKNSDQVDDPLVKSLNKLSLGNSTVSHPAEVGQGSEHQCGSLNPQRAHPVSCFNDDSESDTDNEFEDANENQDLIKVVEGGE